MAETRIDGPRGGEARTGKAMAQSMSSAKALRPRQASPARAFHRCWHRWTDSWLPACRRRRCSLPRCRT